MQKIKQDYLFTSYKFKKVWIKDLNVSLKKIKLLEENIGKKISDIYLDNTFFLIYLLDQRKQKKK